MRTPLRIALALATACGLAAAPARAELHVVATVTDLGSIAGSVLGDPSAVTVLARPTQDPHFVDARPNLMLPLNRADAIVLVGAELEVGWLPVLLKGARNGKILFGEPGYIEAAQLVPLKEVPTVKVDRSMGDIHPSGNPHITTDPMNGILIARGLADRFSRLDPAGAERYHANAEKFVADATARVARWKASLAAAAGKSVVTYHASWVYFTDFAGLEIAGTVEPKPGIPPNAQHVAALIARMKSSHVPIILQESWYGSATSEIIAQNTGARLVVIPGMTKVDQPYLDHIDDVVNAVVHGLAGG
jgi:zinc/manganese transport system substrate-binding protein